MGELSLEFGKKRSCGSIMVKGRKRKLYRGKKGGAYYRTKSGKKYVKKGCGKKGKGKKRKKKKSKKGKKGCSKKLSLRKLRAICTANGISIYSNARVGINKRTGLPKAPKLVKSCTTLKRRLTAAGLGGAYKYLAKSMACKADQLNRNARCVNYSSLSQADCNDEFRRGAVWRTPGDGRPAPFLPVAAARCQKSPTYVPLVAPTIGAGGAPAVPLVAPGGGALAPVRALFGDYDSDSEYGDSEYGDSEYGDFGFGKKRRVKRPHGSIMVRGRKRKLYKGKNGGLYYRTKSGKTYVSKGRRRRRSRFGGGGGGFRCVCEGGGGGGPGLRAHGGSGGDDDSEFGDNYDLDDYSGFGAHSSMGMPPIPANRGRPVTLPGQPPALLDR